MDCSTRPDRRVLGVAGEYTARLIIEEAGLRVLECNWRDGRRGELDIIARDDTDPGSPWTVVIEVRTRVGRQRGERSRVGRCSQSRSAARAHGRVVSTTRPTGVSRPHRCCGIDPGCAGFASLAGRDVH